MARDVDGLNIRKWASAGTALIETLTSAGLTRSEGFPASFGVDMFMTLQTFNLLLRELTGFVVDVARRGILEWDTDQEYAHPSFAMGSDGLIYKSVQASGGSNPSQNPVTDDDDTYWTELRTAVVNSSVTQRGIIRTAADDEVTDGTATKPAITPAQLQAKIDSLDLGFVPDTPIGLTAGNQSETVICVYWSAPTTGGIVTGYVLEWRTGTNAYETMRFDVSSLLHDITGLTANTLYDIRVQAENNRGASGYLSITHTTGSVLAPSSVRNLMGEATQSGDQRQASFSWDSPAMGAGVISYRYRSRAGTGGVWTAWATRSSRVITLAAGNIVNPSFEYYFEVQPQNTGGTGPVSATSVTIPQG